MFLVRVKISQYFLASEGFWRPRDGNNSYRGYQYNSWKDDITTTSRLPNPIFLGIEKDFRDDYLAIHILKAIVITHGAGVEWMT